MLYHFVGKKALQLMFLVLLSPLTRDKVLSYLILTTQVIFVPCRNVSIAEFFSAESTLTKVPPRVEQDEIF